MFSSAEVIGSLREIAKKEKSAFETIWQTVQMHR